MMDGESCRVLYRYGLMNRIISITQQIWNNDRRLFSGRTGD